MILLLYVDDILITSNQAIEIRKVKVELNKEFEMNDLGAAKRILAIEVERNRKDKTVYLSRELYLKKFLDKFGLWNVK